MPNKTTAALAILDASQRVLLVHPTNAPHWQSWSLPKGLTDDGETPRTAAARECYEETGLDMRQATAVFEDCGVHSYRKGKDLHLYLYRYPGIIELGTLSCSSRVVLKNGFTFPECDKFELASMTDSKSLLNPRQYEILSSVLSNEPPR